MLLELLLLLLVFLFTKPLQHTIFEGLFETRSYSLLKTIVVHRFHFFQELANLVPIHSIKLANTDTLP